MQNDLMTYFGVFFSLGMINCSGVKTTSVSGPMAVIPGMPITDVNKNSTPSTNNFAAAFKPKVHQYMQLIIS